MATSMWELTRLILGEPGDAAGIAGTHGFTLAEVADLLPLVADNLTASWEGAPAPPGAPEPLPGESPEELAARWLGELGAHRAAGAIDLVSYDSFGGPGLDLADADPGFDLDFDGPQAAGHAPDPEPLDAEDGGFGDGPDGHESADDGPDDPDLDDPADDPTDGPPDGAVAEPDLDDPFDLGSSALDDLPDLPGPAGADGAAGLDGDAHGHADGGAAFE